MHLQGLPTEDAGIFRNRGSTLTKRVEKPQNRAMRIILQEGRNRCTQEMRNKLRLLSLFSRRRFFLDL